MITAPTAVHQTPRSSSLSDAVTTTCAAVAITSALVFGTVLTRAVYAPASPLTAEVVAQLQQPGVLLAAEFSTEVR